MDPEVLLELRYELWPHHGIETLRQEISEVLESNRVQIFVGYADEKPIGFIEVGVRNHAPGSENSEVPYVEGWCVRKNVRGKGYGRALMAHAERWATGKGFQLLASDTTSRYPGSLEAHTAIGFKEVKRAYHFTKDLTKPKQSVQATPDGAPGL